MRASRALAGKGSGSTRARAHPPIAGILAARGRDTSQLLALARVPADPGPAPKRQRQVATAAIRGAWGTASARRVPRCLI